jgi:L-arabinokinase
MLSSSCWLQTVRQQMGWPEEQQVAVLIYGGHKAQLELREDALPPGWRCVICNGGVAPCEGPLPPNFQLAPAEAFTPDLVNAADCVLGKIGWVVPGIWQAYVCREGWCCSLCYCTTSSLLAHCKWCTQHQTSHTTPLPSCPSSYGTTSECLAHGKPLVFVRRDFFNEEPFLRKLLELHDACVEMKRKDFFEGRWGAYLQRATQLKCSYRGRLDGAEVVAERCGAQPCCHCWCCCAWCSGSQGSMCWCLTHTGGWCLTHHQSNLAPSQWIATCACLSHSPHHAAPPHTG